MRDVKQSAALLAADAMAESTAHLAHIAPFGIGVKAGFIAALSLAVNHPEWAVAAMREMESMAPESVVIENRERSDQIVERYPIRFQDEEPVAHG